MPYVVDKDRQAAAVARIDELLPDTQVGRAGPHSYWRDAADERVLMGLLTATPAPD